jgi:hypothetical protein
LWWIIHIFFFLFQFEVSEKSITVSSGGEQSIEELTPKLGEIEATRVLTPSTTPEHKYAHDILMEGVEESGPIDAETSIMGSDFEPGELDLSLASSTSAAAILESSANIFQTSCLLRPFSSCCYRSQQ